VAEQDHEFDGAKKSSGNVVYQSHANVYTKKRGACAHYLLENEPIFRLLDWLVSQPLVEQEAEGREAWTGIWDIGRARPTSTNGEWRAD
jgi:hypothetical protein